MRPWLVTAVVGALLSGCVAVPVAPPSPVPLTSRIVAVVAEEHLGEAFAAYAPPADPDGRALASTTLHYRATATERLWSVTIDHGPSEPLIHGECGSTSSEAPHPTCFRRDGVRVAWFTPSGPLFLTSERGASGINLSVVNLTWRDDPRKGTAQVSLDALIGLAKDPRLDTTTDAALASRAAAYPRWVDDPGCTQAKTVGPLPLAPAPGTGSEPIAPQALTAVVAAHVAGTCGADWNPVDPGSIGGMVYLTPGTEWVAAYLSTDRWYARCYWGECTRSDGVITSYLRSSDETYPTHVRMVRPVPGGYLVVEEAALGVDWEDRPFPVPLSVLRDILFDPRLAFTADPSLNAQGERLGICWRLFDYTGE